MKKSKRFLFVTLIAFVVFSMLTVAFRPIETSQQVVPVEAKTEPFSGLINLSTSPFNVLSGGDAGCGNGQVNPSKEECDDGNNTDGDGCSSDCKNEAQAPPPCTPSCGSCPSECGQDASTSSDGCGGPCNCPETPACPPSCTPQEGSCDLNEECCDGLTCVGNKCKPPNDQCKPLGGPCGGSNVCCAGLVCDDSGGVENDTCVAPCTPLTQSDCPTTCGLSSSVISNACSEVQCAATDPCPIDCVWSQWSYCSVSCGGGVETRYHLIEAEFGGAPCVGPAEKTCNTEPCPIDCEWHWSQCSALCNGGIQTVVIDVEPNATGAACPTGTQICNTQDCDEPGVCPDQCGQEPSRVPDGQGGFTECEATDPCPPQEQCPDECGYEGGVVNDGVGGFTECAATDPCDPAGVCPTKCGKAASQVPDGLGGFIQCAATAACKDPAPKLPKAGGGYLGFALDLANEIGKILTISGPLSLGAGTVSLIFPERKKKK